MELLVALVVILVFGTWLKSLFGGSANAGWQAGSGGASNVAGPLQSDPFPSYDQLAAEGAPARGIVISSRPYPKGVLNRGRSFEQFQVVLDVEPEGAPPYQVSQAIFLPRGLVAMIPGSALELRVDRRYPKRIAIVGPAGFTGPWLRSPADFLAELP